MFCKQLGNYRITVEYKTIKYRLGYRVNIKPKYFKGVFAEEPSALRVLKAVKYFVIQ